MPRQKLHFVDIEDIETQMASGIPNETLEELYRFEELMLTEGQQRTTQLDFKLTSILGWSSAALAFLLLSGQAQNVNILVRTRTVAATAIIFIAAAIASWALKTIMYSAPSEEDWFRSDLFDESQRLKKYHVVSMLTAHQCGLKANAQKARRLRRAEQFLGVGIVVITALLAARMF